MTSYSAVGTRLPRIDAIEKVTGDERFTADVDVRGLLVGKILRSPHPHARLLNMDTSRAERMPGVRAILVPRDLPEGQRRIFAGGKVRYAGEPVAAVAAVDADVAEDALAAVDVEYEPLPWVIDPLEATRPGAPLIHEERDTSVELEDGTRFVNICSHGISSTGDVEEGFAQAEYMFEDTYSVQRIHHAYLETHTSIAAVDPAGRIIVWTAVQGQFDIRSGLAAFLGMPMTRIRVIGPALGGGFGGKAGVFLEPYCVLLSQRTGRPVRIALDRWEELVASKPAPSAVITLKTGVTREGDLVAREARVISDTGAHPGSGTGGATWVRGPYRVPHLKIETFSVFTNKSSPGAYRAPGAPQPTFASECQMDRIARELGMDPLDLRLRNLVETGDPSATGESLPKIGFRETLEAGAERAGWRGRRELLGRETASHIRRGWGLACGEWTNFVYGSSAHVTVNEDGTVKLFTGVTDISGVCTSFAQIVAEELRVPPDQVRVVSGDTDQASYAPQSSGSKTTYSMGNAVRIAAENARGELLVRAAEVLDADPEDLEVGGGRIWVKGETDRAVTFAELGTASLSEHGPILGEGTLARLRRYPAFTADVAEVEVDTETGTVRVVRLVASQDVGRAINPLSVEGQIEGGTVQGIGWALTEEMVYDEGRMTSPTLADYRAPTARDIPQVESLIVEVPVPDGPYGAKGVGEPPIVPVGPAVANAICDALGVRVHDLPITPEKIVRALRHQNSTGIMERLSNIS